MKTGTPGDIHGAGPDSAQPSANRMVFLDVMRVIVIGWVIAHHTGQAYSSHAGDWPVVDTAQSDWFAPFFFVNAAFGLGLLFVLAGYFVPRSFDRKGPGRFLKDRWRRVGVPLAIFALFVHLPLGYLHDQAQKRPLCAGADQSASSNSCRRGGHNVRRSREASWAKRASITSRPSTRTEGSCVRRSS